MWTYSQSKGTLQRDTDEDPIATGYSGTGAGRNNPSAQNIPNVGPIPQGVYTVGEPHDEPVLGPYVMNLDPNPGTNTFGRSLFRMHGNNAINDASHGCVIMARFARVAVHASGDNQLTVVS